MKYAKSNPNNCVFLVDTYDTLRIGIPNAIRVANDYLILFAVKPYPFAILFVYPYPNVNVLQNQQRQHTTESYL